MVRLSVQFLRKHIPTASLAVWAYVVDDGVMQHDVLLGRDSWMRFNDRSYRNLSSQRSSDAAMGKLTLDHHQNEGATAFVHDVAAVADSYQLRYAGQWPIQLRPEHQLVQVELVRRDGSPALVGHYLVDMLPQTSMFSSEEHFVSNGCQRVPLAGVSFLQPGDVLGMAPAPLLRVPLSAIPHEDSNDDLQAASDSSASSATGADGSVSSRAEAIVHNCMNALPRPGAPKTSPTLWQPPLRRLRPLF